MTNILAYYPALTVIDGRGRNMRHGDVFVVKFDTPRGDIWRSFKIRSIEAAARAEGKDVEAAIKREKEVGGELYYAVPLPSVLSAWQRDKEVLPGFHFGDRVRFEGKVFKLEPHWNDNVKLVEIEDEAAQ